MQTLSKIGFWLVATVMVLALFPVPARAGPWLRYDYEYTWVGYTYVNGVTVAGTWTVKTSYEIRWRDGNFHTKGHGDQRFESDDGALCGHGVTNFNSHQPGTLRNFTRTYHLNFILRGEGLVQRTKVVQHSTYNANGELTSFVNHYDR